MSIQLSSSRSGAEAARGLRRAGVAVGLLVACAGLADAAQAQAQSRVYRCESADGTPLYQNAPGKGCRELDLAPLTTVPAPKGQPRPAAGVRPAPNAATAAAFPRVDGGTQRERDSDRRRILEDELKREQDRLAQIRKEFNEGEPERRGDERNYQKYLDRVERLRAEMGQAESGVAALERELGTR